MILQPQPTQKILRRAGSTSDKNIVKESGVLVVALTNLQPPLINEIEQLLQPSSAASDEEAQ